LATPLARQDKEIELSSTVCEADALYNTNYTLANTNSNAITPL